MCNINHPKFRCKTCGKNVQEKDKAVQCDLCEHWIHMKCNNLYLDYRYLQNCNKSWYCIKCCSTIFPFNFLSSSKNFLACCTTTDSNITQLKDLESDHDSSLLLKPSANLGLLVNQFNNATPENGNDPEKIASSKYYDIDEMHNFEIPHKNKPLSLFIFDITTVSETRITKNVSLLNNLNLNNYSFEFTSTDTFAGGTLLYIANHLSYECCNDLNIYTKNELKSTFIEIVNPKKSNIHGTY